MKAEDAFAKKIIDILSNNVNDNTEDDKTFRKDTKQQITNRDTEYTQLLSHFVKITKIRNSLKEFFKWTFYLVIIASIIILIVIVFRLFDKFMRLANIDQILKSVPLLITSMIGFVSTIITIPVTITKYLFSTKEDKNITKIILHTQDHDTSGRQWAMDFKKMVEGLEETSIKNDKEYEHVKKSL